MMNEVLDGNADPAHKARRKAKGLVNYTLRVAQLILIIFYKCNKTPKPELGHFAMKQCLGKKMRL